MSEAWSRGGVGFVSQLAQSLGSSLPVLWAGAFVLLPGQMDRQTAILFQRQVVTE